MLIFSFISHDIARPWSDTNLRSAGAVIRLAATTSYARDRTLIAAGHRIKPDHYNPITMLRIGIDLGGSKIEAVALAADGAERVRRRRATPVGDYAATVGAIAGLVGAIEDELGESGSVGIGTPGAVSAASGRMKNCNSTWLNGQPLADDLTRALARPVRLANDADCFALSEARDGAGRDAAVVFGVILGTGVGGGIVVDGRLLHGADAIAGEWGHNPLAGEPAGLPAPACYCGRHGCVETYLSGPALAADYRLHGGAGPDVPAMIARMRQGERLAEECWQRYLDRLARALGTVVNILDPHVIVLGGGLSAIPELYAALPPRLVRHVFSDRLAARIVPPVHGAASGVRGAARLWGEAGP